MSFQTLEAVATQQRVVRVDLLPPEIAEARRSKSVRAGLGAALLAVVAAAGVGYVITLGHVDDANQALAAEQSRTAGLQAAQTPYAEVPKVNAQLTELQAVKTSVTANDVAWYRYVDGLTSAAPAETAFTSVVFALNDTSKTTTTESSDPLAVSGIGTLSVNGQTSSQAAVADWMDGLGRSSGLADARLSSSTLDPQTGLVSFTTTATVTADALSHRQ